MQDTPSAALAEGSERVEHLIRQLRLEPVGEVVGRPEDLGAEAFARRLEALSPQAILDRGYAHVTRGSDGRTVRGGIASNPLGKRAIYLDWSLLRIHGTPSRRSIGRAASNGCIRMLNEDVIDLYEKAHVGAPVIAINNKADAARFSEHKVSGKLSAYSRVIKRD